ncbi:MAG: pilus assembly protein PilQ [Sorangium cellulosum]|nr:MAG: pilus assembly protein PilQ [Sorangium cellulosum]
MRLSRGALSWTLLRALLAAVVVSVAPVALAKKAPNHVKNVTVSQSGPKTRVVVQASAPPRFHAQLASGGKRLIIDISNADIVGKIPAVAHSRGVVGGVVAQPYETPAGKTARIFVQLRKKSSYRIRAEGTRLLVLLEPADETKATPIGPRGPSLRADRTPTTPATPRINRVQFRHDSRSDSVILHIDGKPDHSQLSPRAGVSRLVLRDVQLSESAQRTLDVAAFGGLVRTISTYKAKGSSNVIVEVERADRAIAALSYQRSKLVWTFALAGDLPSSLTGVAADGGAARKTRTVAREPKLSGIPKVHGGSSDYEESEAKPAEAGAFLPGAQLGQRRRYRGRRIELDLKDADIHNVLRLLADVGGVNIVTADNVSGSVTIRMRNVPWDRALAVVLKAKSLGMIREGNVIRVAPLAELEKEREMAIARRKQEYELTPVETRLIPVSYAAAADIQNRAKDLLSPRGSIAVDDRTNVLIARDVPGNLNQVEELVRSLDTQTPQVLVEARIVEATSRYLRDIGVQWGGDASFSSATGNPTGLAFPSSVGLVGGASDAQTPTGGLSPFTNTVSNHNFAVNLPATVGTGQGGALGMTFGHINNTINLALRLSAAETSGMVRIISSPRILTLDNHEANISQGTLIPFSQVSAMGVQTTFREAKLQLRVKPHVTADGSVSMHVKVNRDEPDFTQTSAQGDPTILKREAETDLLVMDGHTAVIGGIFTRNTGRNLDQIPFFGDIPLIGLLFQRRRASDSRSELVIFLTPRIVNRAEALGH